MADESNQGRSRAAWSNWPLGMRNSVPTSESWPSRSWRRRSCPTGRSNVRRRCRHPRRRPAPESQTDEPLKELTLGRPIAFAKPLPACHSGAKSAQNQTRGSHTSLNADVGGNARRLVGRRNACAGLGRGTVSRSRTRPSTRSRSNGPIGSRIVSTGCSRRQTRCRPIYRCSTMWVGASRRSRKR